MYLHCLFINRHCLLLLPDILTYLFVLLVSLLCVQVSADHHTMAPRGTPKATQIPLIERGNSISNVSKSMVLPVRSRTNTGNKAAPPVGRKGSSPLPTPNSKAGAKRLMNPVRPLQDKPLEKKVTAPTTPGRRARPPTNNTESVKKSIKKKRTLKPAHSGVPVPEKMKKLLLTKFLQDENESRLK
ncbi:uncharacterized protein LOC105386591 [Plutella xylostella]|uniref:uncharacterized protein LOC105386591 n=1 Tax=Plutella xylostella TaxID=51655 RepID=UPI0020321D6F|nr:uncharacterized protein LOC105386591 [Plutella xylostella]